MADKSLFSLNVELYPDAAEKTRFYSFEVPTGCRELSIDFAYEPKKLEDVQTVKEIILACAHKYLPPPYCPPLTQELIDKATAAVSVTNLLTISLDAPDGSYVGSAHRYNPKQHHEIRPDRASPGFIPISILPGIWRLGLQCHAIVTDVVKVDLSVKGVF